MPRNPLLRHSNSTKQQDRRLGSHHHRHYDEEPAVVGEHIVEEGIAWVLLAGNSHLEGVVHLGRLVEGIADRLGSSLGCSCLKDVRDWCESNLEYLMRVGDVVAMKRI